MNCSDARTIVQESVIISESDNTFSILARHDLKKELRCKTKVYLQRLHNARNRSMFESTVFSFRILSDQHNVQIFSARWNARNRDTMKNVSIEVQYTAYFHIAREVRRIVEFRFNVALQVFS
jgi:hypothetical protein